MGGFAPMCLSVVALFGPLLDFTERLITHYVSVFKNHLIFLVGLFSEDDNGPHSTQQRA
jgi:hypothetical protein